MAKTKKTRRASFKIPLAPTAGVIYGVVAPGWGGGSVAASVQRAINGEEGMWLDALKHFVSTCTGLSPFDGTFNFANAKLLHGVILGGLIHKYVGGKPLNVNRFLRGLPISV